MRFGEFVVAQVLAVVAVLTQFVDKGGELGATAGELYADEDLRAFGVLVAVVELGDVLVAEQGAEGEEAAGAFGDGDGEQAFALFADFGALGDVTQAVEVDVGAGDDVDKGEVLATLFGRPFFAAGGSDGTGGFGDSAGVVKEVFHRRADFIGADGDEVIHMLLDEFIGEFARHFHRDAVGEDADVVQRLARAAAHSGGHGGGILWLDADDFDIRTQAFRQYGDASEQATAAAGHEDGIDVVRMLGEDFQRNGALSGNHVRIVEGMDIGVAVLFLQGFGVLRGGVVEVAVQDDFHVCPAEAAHRIDFDGGGGDGHDDDGADAEAVGGKCHALGVVTGRGADDAACAFARTQAVHLGVGAAQLERKNGLQVFAFAENVVPQAVG